MLREIHRVLNRTGWAILLVPITVERTVEFSSISDPSERLRLFGQEDHVRKYGPDYVDRLREAGFNTTECRVADIIEKEERVHLGLTAATGGISFCRKGT